jgi:hypothetical protein
MDVIEPGAAADAAENGHHFFRRARFVCLCRTLIHLVDI